MQQIDPGKPPTGNDAAVLDALATAGMLQIPAVRKYADFTRSNEHYMNESVLKAGATCK